MITANVAEPVQPKEEDQPKESAEKLASDNLDSSETETASAIELDSGTEIVPEKEFAKKETESQAETKEDEFASVIDIDPHLFLAPVPAESDEVIAEDNSFTLVPATNNKDESSATQPSLDPIGLSSVEEAAPLAVRSDEPIMRMAMGPEPAPPSPALPMLYAIPEYRPGQIDPPLVRFLPQSEQLPNWVANREPYATTIVVDHRKESNLRPIKPLLDEIRVGKKQEESKGSEQIENPLR